MEESLNNANEELKRADHLIFVSLKYTRTIDVIKNIIDRLISAYDFLIIALLAKLKKEGKIEEFPESPIEKANMVNENYDNPIIKENINLYLLYRRIMKSKFGSSQEYRRHVTMIVTFQDGTTMNIDIDKIYEYYKRAKEFFEYVKKMSDRND